MKAKCYLKHGHIVITAHSELQKVLFLVPAVCGFFCLCMKYLGEPLNGFVPNSHGRHVGSVTQMSFKVKVKVTRDKKWHFSALSAACMRFVFGKTSLASSTLN